MITLLLALSLAPQDGDPFVEIDDLLVDSLVYENMALTRVRVTLVNTNHDQERSVGLTLLTPDDAVAYEFDAYSNMTAEREVAIPASDALAAFMRMADRARSREVGPVVFSTPKAYNLREAVLEAMNQLADSPNFSRAVVEFALSAPIEGAVLDSSGSNKRPVPSGADVPVKVDSFSVKISGRYAASLLQEVGAGRYQMMTYPLHGGDAPVLEAYFCHFVEKLEEGAYRCTLPFAVSGRVKVRTRQARVRILSADDLADVACPSHESTAVDQKKNRKRAELHIAPEESLGTNPIRVTYRLGGKAAPVDPGEPQRKKWPSWERNPRDVRDPLYMPADAIASVAEAAGSKRVSAETALLVASNDLFWEVGVRPPKEVEQPFRTPRRIVK